MKYELWHSHDRGSDVYTLLPAGAQREQTLLEPNAKVIWTIDAESWNEACQKQHEFLGWEPYKPMPES